MGSQAGVSGYDGRGWDSRVQMAESREVAGLEWQDGELGWEGRLGKDY